MKNRGFTLIELLIVMVIVAILAAVAYPSYKDYVLKSRRTDAKSALASTAQAMERYYTEKMKYKDAVLGSASGNVAPTVSPDGYYTIGFDTTPTAGTACAATSTTSPSETAFRLCATPTGSQTSDKCTQFSLSNTGIRASTPSGLSCW